MGKTSPADNARSKLAGAIRRKKAATDSSADSVLVPPTAGDAADVQVAESVEKPKTSAARSKLADAIRRKKQAITAEPEALPPPAAAPAAPVAETEAPKKMGAARMLLEKR